MTNEKNTYLTVFESISDPAVILDDTEKIVNLNNAASLLVDPAHIPGGHYYHAEPKESGAERYGKHASDSACIGRHISEVFPWLAPTLRAIASEAGDTRECDVALSGQTRIFEIKRSKSLDVSEKLTGEVVVFRDITLRKSAEEELRRTIEDLGRALSEVKRLSGLLPICSNCKKVRDDKGYWNQVEEYLEAHSEATFSHGICPDCLRTLYPYYAEQILHRDSKK